MEWPEFLEPEGMQPISAGWPNQGWFPPVNTDPIGRLMHELTCEGAFLLLRERKESE